MVIDKWTRTSNNNSLMIPLLGHKSKETFSELKKEYERFQNINHKFKSHSKGSPPKGSNTDEYNLEINDFTDIRDYIDKIRSILLSINELLSEKENYKDGPDKIDQLQNKEINSLTDKILLEYDLFLKNMKVIEKNNNNCLNDLEINSKFDECRKVVEEINKKLKKDKEEENTTEVQEQRRNINNNNNTNNNINRNIDRGRINILTHRREFNNSSLIVKNNFHYTIEEEGFSNGVKLCLFFMVVFLVIFVGYMSI